MYTLLQERCSERWSFSMKRGKGELPPDTEPEACGQRSVSSLAGEVFGAEAGRGYHGTGQL